MYASNAQIMEESEPAPERRGGDARYVSIFRAGKVSRADGAEELCVIRNISAGGAMLVHNGRFAVGDPVSLDLRLEERFASRVAWVKDDRCGIAFVEPIDLPRVLAAHEGERHRPRPPRLNVSAAARLTLDGASFAVELKDIAQTGACIAIDDRVLPRAPEFRVVLDGLGDFRAMVRWRNGGLLGVQFASTLPVWPLNDWVRSRR